MTVADYDLQLIAINGFDDSDDDCVLCTPPHVGHLAPTSPIVAPEIALPPAAVHTSPNVAPVNALAPVATVGPANLWFGQHFQAPATPAKSDDEDSLLEEANKSNGMLPAKKGAQKKATKDGKGKRQRMRKKLLHFHQGHQRQRSTKLENQHQMMRLQRKLHRQQAKL